MASRFNCRTWWGGHAEVFKVGDGQSFYEDEIEFSTGLEDKNGKEIFEGDTIRWASSWRGGEIKGWTKGKVVFHREDANRCGWVIDETPTLGFKSGCLIHNTWDLSEVEIVELNNED